MLVRPKVLGDEPRCCNAAGGQPRCWLLLWAWKERDSDFKGVTSTQLTRVL